ncbi:MAG: NAD(P)H-hydrate epimerase [Planctomycetes bacterium]|jgi:NAD(P)H-hydrate epimerase|nr:NAD(P)H-hydrate epimerase [Planctomycetota bacterium]
MLASLAPISKDFFLPIRRFPIPSPNGTILREVHVQSLTRDQVRAVDRIAAESFGIPGIVLMENAGRGATDLLLAHYPDHPVYLVVAGRGNNGGDGFVIARHLTLRGKYAEVALLGELPTSSGSGDAGVNLRILTRMGVRLHPLRTSRDLDALLERPHALVVDALLGTGVAGTVMGLARDVIERVNASGLPVLAVDTPSGLDCDTGRPLGAAIHATTTVTFAAMKSGFLEPGAEYWTGRVHVTDIGAPIVWE